MNKYTFITRAPELNLLNSDRQWSRNVSQIPGGTQTFSKAPFQHVAGVSPKVLNHGKGCWVWDEDNNEYIDYMMGLGPVILGHANAEVNQAIMAALTKGVSLSLPHSLEAELAEKLCRLIPSAEMVRFGKNGSDATTGAIRAARAITGREKIACCGYHGWQDWYIGSTGRSRGVPKAVQMLTLKFDYNNLESLEKIFSDNPGEIAAVIMEPVNFYEPKNNFLENVKSIVRQHGALLVFDEIITGFRMGLGGAQDYYKVIPDFSCFGKAMANGMPISAIVGKKEYMKVFDDIFYSFTFGGELASLAASIKTIEVLEREQGISQIHCMGNHLKEAYRNIVNDLELSDITEMIGFDWWPEYIFYDRNGNISLEIQSLFQQEIVRRGVLTRAGMMISTAHTEEVIRKTIDVFSESLAVIKEAVSRNKVLDWLDGDVITPVIRKQGK